MWAFKGVAIGAFWTLITASAQPELGATATVVGLFGLICTAVLWK